MGTLHRAGEPPAHRGSDLIRACTPGLLPHLGYNLQHPGEVHLLPAVQTPGERVLETFFATRIRVINGAEYAIRMCAGDQLARTVSGSVTDETQGPEPRGPPPQNGSASTLQ